MSKIQSESEDMARHLGIDLKALMAGVSKALDEEITKDPLARVLREIRSERERQDAKWGEQNHPDGTGGPVMVSEAEEMRARCQFLADHGGADWRAILLEEVYEALAEDDPAKLRAELIQVAAVAANWVEDIDRRTAQPSAVTSTGEDANR